MTLEKVKVTLEKIKVTLALTLSNFGYDVLCSNYTLDYTLNFRRIM